MKPFEEQTYYELLEISHDASSEDILSAHERQLELCSEDSVALYALESPEQGRALRERLTEAMEILTDSDLRIEYDRIIGVVPPRAPPEALLRREEEDEDEGQPGDLAELVPVPVPTLRAPLPTDGPVAAAPALAPEVVQAAAQGVASPAAEGSAPVAAPVAAPAEAPVTVPAAAQPPSPPPPGPASSRPPPRADHQLAQAPQLAQEGAILEAEAAMAGVSARVASREPRAQAPELSNDAEFSGELLRRIRESRGMTLQRLADVTRISSRHLQNIEADEYKQLPTSVYLRGMLMNVARELGLDPLRVVNSYLALAGMKR